MYRSHSTCKGPITCVFSSLMSGEKINETCKSYSNQQTMECGKKNGPLYLTCQRFEAILSPSWYTLLSTNRDMNDISNHFNFSAIDVRIWREVCASHRKQFGFSGYRQYFIVRVLASVWGGSHSPEESFFTTARCQRASRATMRIEIWKFVHVITDKGQRK